MSSVVLCAYLSCLVVALVHTAHSFGCLAAAALLLFPLAVFLPLEKGAMWLSDVAPLLFMHSALCRSKMRGVRSSILSEAECAVATGLAVGVVVAGSPSISSPSLAPRARRQVAARRDCHFVCFDGWSCVLKHQLISARQESAGEGAGQARAKTGSAATDGQQTGGGSATKARVIGCAGAQQADNFVAPLQRSRDWHCSTPARLETILRSPCRVDRVEHA